MKTVRAALLVAAACLAGPALAGDATPAKALFGAKGAPAALAPVSIGSYAKGCLGGGEALPIDGPTWQVMRLSRNRNWGHPVLIDFAERLAARASAAAGWPGLLFGDLAQPRGGPMVSGHASHQIGLDIDIWLNPSPARRLTAEERENISAVSMLGADKRSVDPKIWTRGHLEVIKAAATDPAVARIFVNPAIKKALCEGAGKDRDWLRVVRPWYGHHYHFHVRLDCPASSGNCVAQKPPPAGDGCGAELDAWLKPPPKKPAKPAAPKKPAKPAKPKPEITMNDLPAACRQVLAAPGKDGVVPTAYAPAPAMPAEVPLPKAPPASESRLPDPDVPLPVPSPARRS
ncbi:MAG: penicillin-insensitive murein endopeptidase [Hyphomicrobiales bacterium]